MFTAFSQQKYYDFGFERDLTPQVTTDNGHILKFPWAGGMNECQFSAIDLNFDGIKDLFVFDKSGNRILTFLNNGTAGQPDYIYAPEYEQYFPALHDWATLIDYNKDGKEDIFSCGYAGIAVYRNISDPINGIKFQFLTNALNAIQYKDTTNLYSNSSEFPAFADFDGSGTLDILAFFPLGTYAYYFKNYSKVLYNNYDSLNYKLAGTCWGSFGVSSNNNKVTLDLTCPYKCCKSLTDNTSKLKNTEHMGNTLLALDTKGNGTQDILLGDYDYPGLTLLINGGTQNAALITAQDTAFPSNTKPVHLYSFPVASYLDVDNDGLKDLIVSPFDSRPNITDNYNSVWFYKNTGNQQKPVFTFQSENFLQGDMIDLGGGAYPVLFDYDNDGLMDIVAGNYGYRDSSYYNAGSLFSIFRSKLALFRNTGTKTNPQFTLITKDFADVASLGLLSVYPAFADLNGDGNKDMILGNADGSLLFYINTALKDQPANFVLNQTNYQKINVGLYSTPQLIDIDGDSLVDLVVGNQKGTIYYYRNTGTKTSPKFTLITKNFGQVNVMDTLVSYYGYSVPCFFRGSDNKLRLAVGSQQGNIYYYKDIEANINGKFTSDGEFIFQEGNSVRNIVEGANSSVAVGDLNNDGFPDLLVGNFAGGLSYFKGITPPPVNSVSGLQSPVSHLSFSIYPNPAKDNISLETFGFPSNTNLQLSIYNILGRLIYSKTFTNRAKLTFTTSAFSDGVYICNLSSIGNSTPGSLNKKLIINR